MNGERRIGVPIVLFAAATQSRGEGNSQKRTRYEAHPPSLIANVKIMPRPKQSKLKIMSDDKCETCYGMGSQACQGCPGSGRDRKDDGTGKKKQATRKIP